MSDYYWLDENKNIYKVELLEWAKKFEEEERHVRHTFIKKYDVEISTVFLGLDHGYPQWSGHSKNYRPIVFETMIFWTQGHELDQYQERYSTWKQALDGHRAAVRTVINYIREENAKSLSETNN